MVTILIGAVRCDVNMSRRLMCYSIALFEKPIDCTQECKFSVRDKKLVSVELEGKLFAKLEQGV